MAGIFWKISTDFQSHLITAASLLRLHQRPSHNYHQNLHGGGGEGEGGQEDKSYGPLTIYYEQFYEHIL